MTDSQRTKFWRSIRTIGGLQPPMTDAEIRELVLTVVKTAWFRKRAQVQPMMGNTWKITDVEIRHAPNYTQCHTTWIAGKTRANAKTKNYTLQITIGGDERRAIHVFHALAHITRPDHEHSPPFCKALIEMVARFDGIGPKKDLQAAFRANRCRFYVYSDEAKAGMRARAQARDLIALRDELAGPSI